MDDPDLVLLADRGPIRTSRLTTRPAIRRLSEVETTATGQRPAAHVVRVVAGGLATLVFVDLLLGVEFFNVVVPALVADVLVIAAVALATVSPPRTIAPAMVLGSAASIAVSLVVDVADSSTRTPVMGNGAWPGFAEFAGLGLLTAWSVRSSSRKGAMASSLALGFALLAIVAMAQSGRPFRSVGVAVWRGRGWPRWPPAGTCACSTPASSSRRQQVRHQERLAIARELHDVVAHHVTGIVVQAQAAQLVADQQPDAAQRALDRIARAGGEALAAMRAMVGALRDESTGDELVPTASISDLRAIAESTASERDELPVRLAIDDRAATLPEPVIASVHRIAREAVTNARRHSVGADQDRHRRAL